MDTKEYILELLNSMLSVMEPDEMNFIKYDIAPMQELVNKIKSEKEYFLEFVLDLSENDIDFLSKSIQDEEERKSFLASVIYLKKLIEVNKSEGVSIPLSDNQKALLYKLYDLMNETIVNYNAQEEKTNKNKSKVLGYENLKDELINNKPLTITDYELTAKMVYAVEKGNIGSALNEVMDYLNRYNYDLLAPKDEKVVVNEETINEVVPEPEIKEEKKKRKNKKAKKSEEKTAEENDNSMDIFSPQSFEYNNETIKKGKDKKAKVLDIQTILSSLNIKEEDLTNYAKDIISKNADLELISNNYYYFIDNIKGRIKETNINGIISILCLSSPEMLKKMFAFFKKIQLGEDAINNLFNRCTDIFFVSNIDKFKNNSELLFKYTDNIENVITNNITFFYNSYEYNKNKIDALEKLGLDITKVIENKPQLLAIGYDTLVNNINVIKDYGYNLEEIDYDSISIIGSKKLNKMIDLFIESGFSEYITEKEGLKNTRSLIIKRIFYAFKNKLSVWDENVNEERKNKTFEDMLAKEKQIVNEEDIHHLINEHPILEAMLESKRPYLFNDTTIAQIKRKYEFKIDNNTFSRIKTYSVFNVLINHDIEEKQALFYALTYNSNLTDSEYNALKKELMGE